MRNPCGLVGSRESLTLCLACHAKVISTFYIPGRETPEGHEQSALNFCAKLAAARRMPLFHNASERPRGQAFRHRVNAQMLTFRYYALAKSDECSRRKSIRLPPTATSYPEEPKWAALRSDEPKTSSDSLEMYRETIHNCTSSLIDIRLFFA